MTLLYTLCGIIVAFLFVYLVVALLKPEMFP
ncbi:MAG: K(+)-transporting ATPase subunit F [Alphaproteobacteria bacterium]|nr:K(+)-transporting ATPase subunit F [Alphaproteobacteria bacterium]MBP7760128.1 K(+)-transporting ATPase subunit F [Alphaproteobacteria bacterium]MBP7763503.1 K(+)-transporting ATPase subunit F [Alphaproteobacteria bacterium]MBP7906013.1 K(+)-transporting ATPase subunit F [Alphaproteobacteria bacterium]